MQKKKMIRKVEREKGNNRIRRLLVSRYRHAERYGFANARTMLMINLTQWGDSINFPSYFISELYKLYCKPFFTSCESR